MKTIIIWGKGVPRFVEAAINCQMLEDAIDGLVFHPEDPLHHEPHRLPKIGRIKEIKDKSWSGVVQRREEQKIYAGIGKK